MRETQRQQEQFHKSMKVGDLGEVQLQEYLSRYPEVKFRNVSLMSSYQKRGIDFVAWDTKRKLLKRFEVKTDVHTTGNVFLEHLQHKEMNAQGYLHTSQAEVLVYYFPNGIPGYEENAFFFDFASLRRFVEENQHRYRIMRYREVTGGLDRRNRPKTATGWTVSVKALENAGVLLRKLTWEVTPTQNDWKITDR